MNYLKNIIRVEYIEAKDLGDILLKNLNSIKLSDNLSFKDVCLTVPASIEINDKIENKERIYTTKLIFKSIENIDYNLKHFVYRVTTADKNIFVIGTNARPYALTTVDVPFPSSVTDSSAITYTVTYSAAHSMLKLL